MVAKLAGREEGRVGHKLEESNARYSPELNSRLASFFSMAGLLFHFSLTVTRFLA